MPGIDVRDQVRDEALNERFHHHFKGEPIPPALILNCGVSLAALLHLYESHHLIPANALNHAMHQSWSGIAEYREELEARRQLPRLGIVHSGGIVEFLLVCGAWTLVHGNRIIFPIAPLHYGHPLNKMLGEDISGELWRDQGLDKRHSALLWNC